MTYSEVMGYALKELRSIEMHRLYSHSVAVEKNIHIWRLISCLKKAIGP